MLKETTIAIIQQILDGDNQATQFEKEQVMKACRVRPQRKVIPAKKAMEILQISRPTLR